MTGLVRTPIPEPFVIDPARLMDAAVPGYEHPDEALNLSGWDDPLHHAS
jgi:hypothetical protein